MFKHLQAIRRQEPTNYLSVFDHFVRLVLKGLTSYDLQQVRAHKKERQFNSAVCTS